MNMAKKKRSLVSIAMYSFEIIVTVVMVCGLWGCDQNTSEVSSSIVESAECAEDLTMFAKCGEILYKSIHQANIDREAAGLETLWPRSRMCLSQDKADMSGRFYNNSAAYFIVLFDLANVATANWRPYLDCDPKWAIGKAGSLPKSNPVSLWSVALDINDKMDDNVPVLISSNLDCAKLPLVWAGTENPDDKMPITTHPLIGNHGVVIVTKGGKILKLPSSKVTLRNICGDGSFAMPKQYLTPDGVVNIGR